MSNSGKDVGYCFFTLIFGVGVYLWGLGQYRLKKFIEYTPTSKAVSVAPGVAEVAGKAEPVQTFTSPLMHKQCVYYKTIISRWVKRGKGKSKEIYKTLDSGSPFYIQDETGKVLVDPGLDQTGKGTMAVAFGSILSRRATYSRELIATDKKIAGTPRSISAGFFNVSYKEGSSELVDFLKEHAPSIAGYSDGVEVEEHFIEEGDPVYMIGVAQEKEINGQTAMVVGRDKEKGVFCISDGTENKTLWQIALWAYGALLAGPAIVFFCLIYLFLRLGVSNDLSVPLSFFAIFGMYAYVFITMLLEFANSMIILKNNVERARANVDVLLTRKTDLISNLVEVVKAAAKHERTLQSEIAKVRAQSLADSAQLLAIAENYPTLQADQNFKQFSDELRRTEDWIAGSRAYVSDSIMLYNTKISSFPYFFFSPLMGLKKMDFSVSVE